MINTNVGEKKKKMFTLKEFLHLNKSPKQEWGRMDSSPLQWEEGEGHWTSRFLNESFMKLNLI